MVKKNTLLAPGLGQFFSLLVTFYGSYILYTNKPLKAKWGFFAVTLGYLDVKANFFGGIPLKGRGDLLTIVGVVLYATPSIHQNCAHFVLTCCTESFNGRMEYYLCQRGGYFIVIGFSFAMFLFYSGTGGSRMLNLSLLTSNIWAVLIQIFVFHEKVDWMYFVAFAAVTLGLIIFLRGDKMYTNNSEATRLSRSHNARISNMKISKI